MDLQLGFLASHNGSNVKAIVEAIEIGQLEGLAKVIISNNTNAQVLEFAKEKNIPYYCLNAKSMPLLDDKILEKLYEHEVNLVVLAGYMKKVGEKIIQSYENRILNIHPSLLPKYGGKGMYGQKVHEAVINSSDIESGATVHIVVPEYDKGRILAQYKVPRYERDTPDTLAERVLRIEHVLYPQVLEDIQKELIILD